MAKYKIGDTVKVIANKSMHYFHIGDMVMIYYVENDSSSSEQWYKARILNKSEYGYWITDKEISSNSIKKLKIL